MFDYTECDEKPDPEFEKLCDRLVKKVLATVEEAGATYGRESKLSAEELIMASCRYIRKQNPCGVEDLKQKYGLRNSEFVLIGMARFINWMIFSQESSHLAFFFQLVLLDEVWSARPKLALFRLLYVFCEGACAASEQGKPIPSQLLSFLHF